MTIKNNILLFATFCSMSIGLFGQSHFQQEVNHDINVTLNDTEKALNGHIQTEYINNSKDTLTYIYYHLWPNAYKNENTAFAQQQLLLQNASFHYADKEYRGFIDSLNFFINKKPAKLKELDNTEDIALLVLLEPLLPGDTIQIETDFYLKIPLLSSRLGYEGEDFCISQWYPKPAVYDIYGWHPMSYLDMGEFYSEIGSFKVSISLPDDYIVAATGNLISRTELMRLEDYAEICQSAKNKSDIKPFGDSLKTKTLTYIENNIHDFAWFASKDFIIDRKNVKLQETGKYVTCWSFYHKANADLWSKSVDYVGNAVEFLSESVGEYPYRNCTAVDGPLLAGGGMEYPTITVVTASEKKDLERVIVHEVIHNWFYGILASNERSDQWIDEGFTSFYECKYMDKEFPNEGMLMELVGIKSNIYGLNDIPPQYIRELSWHYLMTENFIQDGSLNSEEMSPFNYFILSYSKPVNALYALEQYLGNENYKQLMRGFYNTHKYQHIFPSSLKTYFQANTTKDIAWFFDDLILSNKTTDYKIVACRNDSIIIKNKGEALAPLFLNIGDSLIIEDGFTGKKKFHNPNNLAVIIDKDFKSLDLNRNNNYYRPGFLKSNKPIKLSFANFLDNPQLTEIPILPIIAYNTTDGFMPGILLYSSPFPKKTFEYQLAPMWGIKTKQLTGVGNMSVFMHPRNTFLREIEVFTSGKRFGINEVGSKMYYRIVEGIRINFKTNPKANIISELLLRNISATDYYFDTIKHYQNFQYLWQDYSPVNPRSAKLNIEMGKGFVKAGVELIQNINYNDKYGLRIRLFGGKFLYNSSTYYGNYNFRLSGNIGAQDYLYDQLYVGRNDDIRYKPESFWSHQFIRNDGGFTLYTPYGQSNNWLVALNLDSGTPLGIIDLYANLGICPMQLGNSPVDFYYEAGIKLKIFKDFLNIYFPLTTSIEIWETSNDIYTDNYLQKIRFTLSLEKINLLFYRNKPFLLI